MPRFLAACLAAIILSLNAASVLAAPDQGWPPAAAGSPAQGAAQNQMRVPPGWQVHRGGEGLVVFMPQGWRVLEEGKGAFMALEPGPGGQGALTLSLAQPMRIEGSGQGVVRNLGQVLPQAFPGVRVSRVQVLSHQPEVVAARLDYQVRGVPYQGWVMCFREGEQGMVYAAAAQADLWPSRRGMAQAVLKSFLYPGPTGPGGQAPAAGLPPMAPWRDPKEGAFTIMVPQGWQVQGGLARFHAIDTRLDVVVKSPDGGILIRVGDAAVPPMTIPNQMMEMAGFKVGAIYDSGYGLKQLVMPYLPGDQFITRYYLPKRLGQVGQAHGRPLEEATRQAQALYNRTGLPYRVDLGDATFTYQGRQGYILVKTLLAGAPGNSQVGVWVAEALYGYLARPDQEPLARAVLEAVIKSFQMDPDWQARQSNTTGKVSQIVAQTNNEINQIIRDTYAYHAKVTDGALERYDRGAVRGNVLVEDPNTGQRFEVPNGSNYYWRPSGANQVVGTQTDTRPQSPNHWMERLNQVE